MPRGTRRTPSRRPGLPAASVSVPEPCGPLIKTYLKDLQHLRGQAVIHELGLKGPFQSLLDKAAKKRGWTLVPELSTYSGGKRVVPDGTRALREGRVNDIESEAGISILRGLRGFQGLITEAIKTVLRRNANNPRFAPHADRAKRDLERSIPQIRNYIKARLLTLDLHDNGEASLPMSSNDGRLGIGLRTEVFLSVPNLRLNGVVDLIDVRDDHVRIIEYKSGDPSPSHVDQVRMYEVLWTEDRTKNPETKPVQSIILQYPRHSQEMFPLSEQEICSFRVTLVKRIDRALDAWTSAGGVSEGPVFRSMNRGDQAQAAALSEKVVWQLLQPYAAAAGVPGIAPHDCRRTCAKLCRAAGGELEQIQLLLGHASVQTTERYLGTKQDLVNAPNDGIKLRVAV
jgi:hypothetical protein